MRKVISVLIFLISTSTIMAQNSDFDKMLIGMYEYSVPLVKHNQLVNWIDSENIYILDARERREYKVSHIKNAMEIGYDNFKIESVKNIPKDAKIVVYCSVGYRSERIGEKLIQNGYKEVYNLYGGIFDWVNNNNAVYNTDGKVKEVHAYNKDWGKWVKEESCKRKY